MAFNLNHRIYNLQST